MNLLKFLFGTKNDRELKKLWPLVRQINALEEKLQAENLTDEDFPKRTAELKARVAETIAKTMPKNPDKDQEKAVVQAALDAVATARNGGLAVKQYKRSGDRHKLPHRISARFTREQAERIKEAVKLCGYGTTQGWLNVCSYRLLREEAKKKAPAGAANTNRGADQKSTLKKYTTGEDLSNV